MNRILDVVVLTRNRPHFLRECLQSIQSQKTLYSYNLIVSDNSSNNETAEFLARYCPHISKRRFYSIPSDEHFKSAIVLNQSKYLMIFHDDDILLPGYLQHAIEQLEHMPDLSAVSCNSYFYRDGLASTTFLKSTSDSTIIYNQISLIQRYLDPWAGGAAPLSPYIYRASALKSDYIDIKLAGKYSDLFFLLCILAHGPFLWLSQPFSYYRIHSGSDNSEFVFKHKLSLLRSLHRLYGLPKQSYLYLNAKSIFYRQFFGVSPSLAALLPSNSRSRKLTAQKLVTKMTLARLLRSHQFRLEKLGQVKKLFRFSCHFRA